MGRKHTWNRELDCGYLVEGIVSSIGKRRIRDRLYALDRCGLIDWDVRERRSLAVASAILIREPYERIDEYQHRIVALSDKIDAMMATKYGGKACDKSERAPKEMGRAWESRDVQLGDTQQGSQGRTKTEVRKRRRIHNHAVPILVQAN